MAPYNKEEFRVMDKQVEKLDKQMVNQMETALILWFIG